MQPKPVTSPVADLMEIDPAAQRLSWLVPGESQPRTVPWFASLGVLDYAGAEQPPRPHSTAVRTSTKAAATGPAFGDPLTVSTDLGAVFWRVGSVLHSAPLRSNRVVLPEAAAVDWTTPNLYHRIQCRTIEHNLAQLCTGPTLDPALHLVQVEATGRVSLSILDADADGCPVIGETAPTWLPCRGISPSGGVVTDLDAYARRCESEMRPWDWSGRWEFVPAGQAVQALMSAGFTVSGPAADRVGLVQAFAAQPDRHWVTGWYGDTRLFALARFIPQPGDWRYRYWQPDSRAVAVQANPHDPHDRHQMPMRAPGNVETLPPERVVSVEAGFTAGATIRPVPAGLVSLLEPLLVDGPLPTVDDAVNWAAACRRCHVPMFDPTVGRGQFTPYSHDLVADTREERSGLVAPEVWCPAHPDSSRPRPHAAVCWVIAPGAPAEFDDVPS